MKNKKFIKIAKEVINLEIKALNKLKRNINDSFYLAVEQILKCQSKVILCGVGKSGLIANKIASTCLSILVGGEGKSIMLFFFLFILCFFYHYFVKYFFLRNRKQTLFC